MDAEEFRRRAGSFGDDAEQYDRARPTYPDAVVDGLLQEVGGGPVDVLDIGCGTGKLGRLFVRRRCGVLGVEPDPRMARVARRYGIDVEVGRFESWPARGRSFRLAVAGQSWHWVDRVAGPRRLAEVIVPGGVFAAAWNLGYHDPWVQDALDEVYAEFATWKGRRGGTPRSRGELGDEVLAPLRRTGAFLDPEVRYVPWTADYSKAAWLDQLPTHSEHRIMPPDALAALLDGVGAVIDRTGGRMRLHMQTEVVVARRR